MYLVDRHRGVPPVAGGARLHPVAVVPFVGRGGLQDAGIVGAQLEVPCVGVVLLQDLAGIHMVTLGGKPGASMK